MADMAVVVEESRIIDVAPIEDVDDDGASVIDRTGETVIPGLIDAHLHLKIGLQWTGRTSSTTMSPQGLPEQLLTSAVCWTPGSQRCEMLIPGLIGTPNRCRKRLDSGTADPHQPPSDLSNRRSRRRSLPPV